MILIICDKSPDKAVDWLVENTNKNFCWKQLLELSQLLASCYITSEMKPIWQGKQIREWIIQGNNLYFIYHYYEHLFNWCEKNIKMLPDTYFKLLNIKSDLWTEVIFNDLLDEPVTTAIWRYSKDYKSEYESNSELPIEVVTELYKEYIKWKFSV